MRHSMTLAARWCVAIALGFTVQSCASRANDAIKSDPGVKASAERAGSDGTLTTCDGHPLPPRARTAPARGAVGAEAALAAGLPPYWPTDDWQAREPAALGFDPQKLAAALDLASPETSTQALLVVRRGYIAAERYTEEGGVMTQHISYSMAKSFASALRGIAIEQGKIASVDEKLCQYYPDTWKCDDPGDPHGKITIHHAVTLTTGIEWQEDWRTGHNGAVGVAGGFVQTALSRPVVDEPGTKQRYSTGDPALLQAVLERATGTGVFEYAQDVLLGPIGIRGLQWNGATSSGILASAREYAKFGYLYLNQGTWDGRQVVPAQWVENTTRVLNDKDPEPDPDPCHDWYYYLWHVNLPNRLGSGVDDPACPVQFCNATTYADLPRDGFFAEGIRGQFIFVIPSADLVVVRLATDPGGIERSDAYARELLVAILDAITG
jgi:CubicO group peptidase (beta-lactamase class C family)